MLTSTFSTPIGILTVTADEDFIYGISFDKPTINAHPNNLIACCIDQCKSYFSGRLKKFDVPYQITGTAFQKMVLDRVNKIQFGQTKSYLQIALELGEEHAVRAIGLANSKNPLPIIIPCHRVIGKDGSLKGYIGGAWRKNWLLNHEKSLYQLSLFPD